MKKILQTLTIAVTLGLTGCNDSYLERLPTTEVTEATAFTSFTTCSNYLTNLYQMFSGGYTSFQGPLWYPVLWEPLPVTFTRAS
ncbi:hypothetical protein [uncultured Bacteroides sp.]|uniref:hypothetical protein n=1 Tax=uncultured Bacteroides sp. TaxID=162156 RepID=UPI002599AD43|nr:hypothetical protein [uncultured Bacteroides sp.]